LSAFGEPPDVAWRDPAGLACAGFGESAVVTAAGAARFAEVERAVSAELGRLVCRAFTDGAPPARVFGGFAFRPGAAAPPSWTGYGDARFVLPRVTYVASGGRGWLGLARRDGEPLSDWDTAAERLVSLAAAIDPSAALEPPGPRGGRELDSPDEDLVRRLQAACAATDGGELDKVVVAHRLRLGVEARPDVNAVLARLLAENPSATVFAFHHGGRRFLGATPERLIARQGRAVMAEALAGSAVRDGASAPEALLLSDKDLIEHGFVVRDLAEKLTPLCDAVDVPRVPVVRELREVVHLLTPIRGRLARPWHVLRLVERVHPTPAVGGTPTAAALAWLERNEPSPRGWYASPVGWVDGSGDGDFVVALRSGLLTDEGAELWAGAGIVAGSEPAAEAAEIRLKLGTFLSALGAARP